MKTKTEAKRRAILNAATTVFRRVGFERASMAEILKKVGGSKATLYNYFPSKERLFFEVMYETKAVELEVVAASLPADVPDFKAALVQLGCELLRLMYAPEAIAIRRLSITESGHSEIGKMCHERTTVPIEKHVAEFLKRAMKRGDLRTADPKYAAMQLLSLYESELLQRMLLGVMTVFRPEAINASVRRAVETFLTGYGKPA